MSSKLRQGPVVLIIMDGIGLWKKNKQNAFHLARTPFLDKAVKDCKRKGLYTELFAHGKHVGLPDNNIMGNSEVGHNAIGAGMVVKQRATLANEAIKSGELFRTSKWKNFVSKIKKNTLHFIGLLSDGYVHSHINHLIGLLKSSARSGIKRVRIHALFDGRDVPAQSSLKYVKVLNKELKEINKKKGFDYRIASGGGRMRVTMDRYESNWNIVKRGWNTHVCGVGEGSFRTCEEAIKNARKESPEINDQFIPSFVIVDENGKPVGKMNDGDGVVNFNFRGDRALMISRAFDEDDFNEFKKDCNPELTYYGLLLYDDKEDTPDIPMNYFIEPPVIKHTLTQFLCSEGVKQFSIAETHKFGHISYFFNGNTSESPCPELDDYKEIKSEPARFIEDNPKMKAYEVRDEFIKALNSKEYDFLKVNFANCDMVGHTGNINSAITAVETVDECVKSIVEKVNELNGVCLITADHGNVEEMDEKFGTSHTTNKVMFLIMDSDYNKEYSVNKKLKNPSICNIAGTVIKFLGYNKPDYFQPSLVKD